MGEAVELVSGFVTNPGAALTALTPSTGNSFTVKAFDGPARCDLLNLWTFNATGGVLSIRSPRLHDNTQGIRLQVPAGASLEYLPRGVKQPLYTVDALSVLMSGGGAETDILSMLVYYSNLPGAAAGFHHWKAIQDRIVDLCGVELDIASGATAGQYGGGRTLNQDFQNLKADESYAVLGYTCASAFASLRISGPDTSNYGIGGPGSTNTDITGDWFVQLSEESGIPLIPVIKANNAGATTVDIVAADTATSHHVSLLLAQLR